MPSQTTLAEALRSPIDYTEQIRLATPGANWRAPLSSMMRPVVQANTTYYVRTDGSNSNNGLSDNAGGAFLTIPYALGVIAGLELQTFTVTLQVRSGTYTDVDANGACIGIYGPWSSSNGTVVLTGDTTTPSNVVISAGTNTGLLMTSAARLQLQGFKFTSSGGGQNLNLFSASYLQIKGLCDFGAHGFANIYCKEKGICEITANQNITGGGNWFVLCDTGGTMTSAGSLTYTLTGTPAFSQAFVYCSDAGSLIRFGTTTFSGSASAGTVRYNVSNLAQIASGTGSTTFFPGGTAGVGTNPSASPWGLYT